MNFDIAVTALVYSNVPIAEAAVIPEPEAGSLMVPELAKDVFTVNTLLPIFKIPEALVILRVSAVNMPVPPTVYVVEAPERVRMW